MNDAFRARGVAGRAVVFWAVAALFVILLAVLRVAAQPLLLAFAGVLFGTSLRGLAELVAPRLGWSVRRSLLACTLVLAAAAVTTGLLLATRVADQFADLARTLDRSVADLRASAAQLPFLARAFEGGARVRQLLGQAAGVLGTVVGILGAAVIVFFVALYVAAGPETYRRGLVKLVPQRHRERAERLLGALASTLRRWLLGRIVSMTAVGVVTSLALCALGIPLPLTLGLIAGGLGFVPNIGPIVSVVPAALVAFTVGPLHVVYVLALYLAINLADGYVLTPWVQQRSVSVPPALIITGQVLAGALWGVVGVTLATPLLACLLVLVRELYIAGVLGDGRAQ